MLEKQLYVRVSQEEVNVLPSVGISLSEYPKLNAWCDRLIVRPSWQTSKPTPEAMEAFKSILMARMAQ
jgi:glutathione S-transferase